ncbi:MAG: hypothetical protein BGO39_35570 [Chloroflexi bacterium 54-19]|nr:MAG: hypothetical protein BGO39_35570 [Chloroflexi bacterium 54-19]
MFDKTGQATILASCLYLVEYASIFRMVKSWKKLYQDFNFLFYFVIKPYPNLIYRTMLIGLFVVDLVSY